MGSKFPMTQLGTSPGYMISPHRDFCVYSKYSRRLSSEQKFPFKFVAQSLGHKWKLNDISTSTFSCYFFVFLLVNINCQFISFLLVQLETFSSFLTIQPTLVQLLLMLTLFKLLPSCFSHNLVFEVFFNHVIVQSIIGFAED